MERAYNQVHDRETETIVVARPLFQNRAPMHVRVTTVVSHDRALMVARSFHESTH